MSMLVIFGVLVMFAGDAMGSLSVIPDCSFTQSDPCYGVVGRPLHLQLPSEYELYLKKNDSETNTLGLIFKCKNQRITKIPSGYPRWQFVSSSRTMIISSAEKRDSGKYFLETFDSTGTSKGVYHLQLDIEEISPPTIHLVEFGQSIMCVIEDFYPKALSIKWKKDDREVRARDWITTENDSGSYRAVSVFEANLTSSSPGTKYTCEVTHGGKTYTKDLSPGAQFSLKINPPQAKDLFINRKAVIECVITGDNQKEVEGATVSWTVGGRSPETRDVRVGGVTQTESSFTKTSTLTLEEFVWFSGTEVICSTSRGQITTSEKISVKKGGQRPSIIIYKPDMSVSDSDMGSLVCAVSSSDLGDVFIMWQVNNGQYTEGNGMATIVEKDNKSIVLSYLTVPGKDYNSAEIACAVKDANMQNDIEPRRSITSTSKVNCNPPVSDRR